MAKFEINVSVNGAATITSLDNQLKSLDKTAQTTGKGIDTASKSTDAMASSLKSLGAIIATVGLVELGRKAVQTADMMNLLEGRVSLVTKSMAEQVAVQNELFKVAQNTRQGLEATTTLYTNLATSMTAMGKSQNDIIKMTETVNKAMIISGSSTQMAQAAILQLGQAFASGTLRGDELNSIMENSKGLAQAIASGMGVPIGKLRELGSEGKITSEILAAALEKSASDIDAKFSKLPQTVGQSLTQVQNSIMSLVGVADDAVNGTGGLSEIFSHFSKYLDQNQADVIEFGADFLRVMQLIGAGALTTISGVQVLIHGITGGIIGAIELSINAVLLFINSAIAMAETGYNKIRSLGGFDAKSLGRISNVDLGSKSQFAGMKKDADDFNIGLKAMGSLFDDIANKTTVIKSNVSDLNAKPLPDGKGGTSQTKEQIAAAKKAKELAEKIAAEELKIKNGYLDAYAELEAKAAIKKYEDELELIRDISKAQNDAMTDNAERFAKILEDIKTPLEKLNESVVGDYNLMESLFGDDIPEEWFDVINKKFEDLKQNVDKMDFSASIEFDPAGLEGTAKAIAGIGKSMSALAKAEAQYEKNKKMYAEGSTEYAKNEEDHTQNQIAGYANMAGAMSAMFKQGSAEAEAFKAVESGLAIVSGAKAVVQAMTNGDPYTAIARGVAMAAMVASVLGGAGIGGGGVSAPPPDVSMGTVLGGGDYGQSESINNIVDIMQDIHVSEYAELRDINRAVTSMADSITSAVTNIFKTGVLDTSNVSLANKAGSSEIWKSLGESFLGGLSGGSINAQLTNFVFGGSSKQSIRASGFEIGAGSLAEKAGGNLGASTYVDVETSRRGLFGDYSYSYDKRSTALDEASANSISLIYDSFKTLMEEVNAGLGTDFADSISNYTLSAININMKDLSGEEAVKKLNDTFSALGDKMSSDVFGELLNQYQQLGEGLLETAVRVITEKVVVIQDLGDIGKSVSGDVIGISQSLVDLSGSLSDFQDNNAAYYDKYFTDAEKQANTQNHLNEAFNAINIAMPSTVEGFRSIVDALDLSTLAGREAYTSMMQVSGSFYEFSLATSEAIALSKENIKSFLNGLMDTYTSLDFSASRLGVNPAQSVEELASLFTRLSTDADGLTDAELQLLDANKNYIASQMSNTDATKSATDALNQQKISFNDYLKTVTSGISTLEGTLSSFKSTIDKLRGSAIGSSYTLDMYQKSMRETLALSGSSDYEAFSKSLQTTIGYSSVLSESSMYQTAQDMAFAQLVAANQFESMQTKTLTQIDYLKLIEENTRGQLAGIEESITSSSASTTSMLDILNAQLNELIGIKFKLTETWEAQSNGSQIWTSTGGATATRQAGATDYTIDAKTGESFTGQEAINFVNAAIASGDLLSIYTNAVKYGISSTSLDAMMNWRSGTSLEWALSKRLPAFLSGGYTGDVPVNNIAGITHGQEYVVNAKTTRDLGLNNSGGIFNEMKEYMKMMQNEIKNMNRAMVQLLSETTINNAGMRNVTNGYSAMMMEIV